MSFNNFPSSKATPIVPSTFLRGARVREYVDYYTDAQQIKLEEVLEVQGVEAVIWNKQLSKRFCTCQRLASSIHNNQAIADNIYTRDFEEAEAVEALGDSPNQSLTRPKRGSRASSIATQNGLGNLSDLISDLYDKDIDTGEAVIEPKIKVITKQQNQIEEALIAQKRNLGIEHNEYINCPICFNTRHVDTYQPYKGQRIVLDASDFYELTTSGVVIDKHVSPWSFEFVGGSSFVEWGLELPKYFKTESIRPFFLDSLQTSCKVEFRDENNPSLTPLTVSSLNQREGLKNRVKIRISPRDSYIDPSKPVRLTHLEIVLRFVDRFDLVDIPSLNIPESLEYIEIFLRSRFTLSSKIDQIMKGSIILEKKLNLAWEVLDLEKTYTASGKIVNQEVDVRLIQNSERLYMLNYLPPKFSMWKSSFIATP